MTATTATSMSSPGTRRMGYAVALAVNAALLVAVNTWPGWRVLPFLTEDLVEVLDLVNLGLAAGIAANAVYLVADRPAVRAVGELATTAIGLVTAIRLLQVFPFAFPGPGFDWALLVRVLLVLGIVGTSIALLVSIGSLIRLVVRSPFAVRRSRSGNAGGQDERTTAPGSTHRCSGRDRAEL